MSLTILSARRPSAPLIGCAKPERADHRRAFARGAGASIVRLVDSSGLGAGEASGAYRQGVRKSARLSGYLCAASLGDDTPSCIESLPGDYRFTGEAWKGLPLRPMPGVPARPAVVAQCDAGGAGRRSSPRGRGLLRRAASARHVLALQQPVH